MDIFDKIESSKDVKREKKPKKSKSSKHKKSKTKKEDNEPVLQVEETPQVIEQPEVNGTEVKDEAPEEEKSVEETKEAWFDEDGDDEVTATPAVLAAKVQVVDINKEAPKRKVTDRILDNNSTADWGQFANAPSPTPKAETPEPEKTKIEEKIERVSRAFVPRHLRGGDSGGMSMGSGMGGPRGSGMGYGRNRPQYKVEDRSAFPTLGDALNDKQPEGFSVVQNKERNHGSSGGARSGLSVSNKFGGLSHD